jgi:hypothetical protein
MEANHHSLTHLAWKRKRKRDTERINKKIGTGKRKRRHR